MRGLTLLVLLVGSRAFGVLTCESKCQYFDSFHDVCSYQTTCLLQGRCVKRTYCDQWDSFHETCQSEADETNCHTPDPHATPPACTAKCQKFDSFHGVCLYKTKCEYTQNQRCVTYTACERWDDFHEKCLTEISQLTCQ